MSNNDREYRVWNEVGEVLAMAEVITVGGGWKRVLRTPYYAAESGEMVHARSLDVARRHAAGEMERWVQEARDDCRCGEDAGPEGLYCGALHPHGISMQVCEGDEDVTQNYLIND